MRKYLVVSLVLSGLVILTRSQNIVFPPGHTGGGGTNYNFNTGQFTVLSDTNVAIKSGSLLTNAALKGYFTVSGKTNRVTDDGTQLLFNGTPISAPGAFVWNNAGGVISPLGTGQLTNVLKFISGLSDNSTNVALVVDTADMWSDGTLFALSTAGTDVFTVTSSAGAILTSPFGSSLYGELGPSFGDNPAWLLYSDNDLVIFDLFDGTGIERTLFQPTIESTGSSIAYLLGTSNTLTNGDTLFLVQNSGNDRFKLAPTSTAHDTEMMLWDVDSGAVQRVSIGATNSGGTGFKVLRIPN